MSRISRLSGAILAETEGQYFLIGDLKEPCDFTANGFEPPGDIQATVHPYIQLSPTRTIALANPVLKLESEGEELAKTLAERLIIQRNGSVSDRLWRMIVHGHEGSNEIDARWLTEVPTHLWQIVRDNVLKCS